MVSKRAAENLLVPARVHALLDLGSERLSRFGAEFDAWLQYELTIRRHPLLLWRTFCVFGVSMSYNDTPVFWIPSFSSALSFSVNGAHSQRGKRSTGNPRMRISSQKTPRP